jgi:hypothetical protein
LAFEVRPVATVAGADAQAGRRDLDTASAAADTKWPAALAPADLTSVLEAAAAVPHLQLADALEVLVLLARSPARPVVRAGGVTRSSACARTATRRPFPAARRRFSTT